MYALDSIGSIFSGYNALLDGAAERDDLEALVLVHQDTEIVGEGFCRRCARRIRSQDDGLVGCVGAIGVRSIAWWEGSPPSRPSSSGSPSMAAATCRRSRGHGRKRRRRPAGRGGHD